MGSKRGRKPGSGKKKEIEEVPKFSEPNTEESFLEKQKRLKATMPEDDMIESNIFIGYTDRKKKSEIYGQLDQVEVDRCNLVDKVKLPEKKIKQIVSRVLGREVPMNKTMLKVIGGIAKVWVGEIVEEAKLIQVREEYEAREALGLNNRYKSLSTLKPVEEDIEVSDPPKDPKEESKDSKEEPKEPKQEPSEIEEKKSESSSLPKPKEVLSDDVLRQTLHSYTPLLPSHLRQARSEYERKREKLKMRIFSP